MEGLKRADMAVGSPIARSPRAPVEAPDPITVVEGALPAPTAASMPARVDGARQLEMRGLVRDMAAAPPVDAGRVEMLKARIAAGSFAIDPARVADAMLGSLRTRD